MRTNNLFPRVPEMSFLIDRSRSNSLVYTLNGTDWTSVALPRIGGVAVGGKSIYVRKIMTLDAHGALVAIAHGSPLGRRASRDPRTGIDFVVHRERSATHGNPRRTRLLHFSQVRPTDCGVRFANQNP